MTRKKEKANNTKAQVAVTGILFAFVLIAIAAIIQEPMLDFIDIGVNASVNATHGDLMVTLIQILPVFIWLVVLIAIVTLVTGRS